MGLNRGQVRANVRENLSDAGITYYSDQEINDSIQDAYNEVAAYTLFNVKTVTLNWVANLNYFDFAGDPNFNVTDYIGTVAIFNISTNQYLRDDVGWRDFDRLRRDWEWWRGTPQFWAPHSVQFVAITPGYGAIPTSGFILTYYGQAPVLTTDASTFLSAADMDTTYEYFATADLLETAEEPAKASPFWASYQNNVMEYKERCHKLAKYELLMKV